MNKEQKKIIKEEIKSLQHSFDENVKGIKLNLLRVDKLVKQFNEDLKPLNEWGEEAKRKNGEHINKIMKLREEL